LEKQGGTLETGRAGETGSSGRAGYWGDRGYKSLVIVLDIHDVLEIPPANVYSSAIQLNYAVGNYSLTPGTPTAPPTISLILATIE